MPQLFIKQFLFIPQNLMTANIPSYMVCTSTVCGKNLEGENFGEFGERLAIRQNFPQQYL